MENMKFQIKHHLNLLLEELEQWRGIFDELDDNENPLSLTGAMETGRFIKKIALEIKDYELVGIAEAVYQKAKKLEDEEETKFESYEETMRQEYWESKTWFNATDIGDQLNPKLNAIQTNKLLEENGFQQRKKKGWVMTDKAIDLCRQRDEEEGERPYIQWKPAIVDRLISEIENT
ncbi:MAG: hypothetical protein Q8L15_01590 [Methylobacter sp.]|nr:hypothetical protein [Methylobacter sp.]